MVQINAMRVNDCIEYGKCAVFFGIRTQTNKKKNLIFSGVFQ